MEIEKETPDYTDLLYEITRELKGIRQALEKMQEKEN